MQIKHFIGIDVSKETLDVALVDEHGKVVTYERIKNNCKHITRMITEFKKAHNIDLGLTIFCMEYTGIYNQVMIDYLNKHEGKIWMESALQIKRSLGAVRGKNDKVDSIRIAEYAFTNRHNFKRWRAPRAIVLRISLLLAQRERFVNTRKQLSVPIKELRGFTSKAELKSLEAINAKPLKSLDKAVIAIEREILLEIRSDSRLDQLYRIITSVDGVGKITATYIITTTNEFIKINEAKKYACYGGVVPFDHSSGSSVRGKSRVSHMANKKIKCLLHLVAMSSIRMEGDMQNYYKRKVAEGKHKMSVLNAIRNKIVHRVFACVRDNRAYQKNYQYALVKP